jgi:hemolysin D
MIKQNRLRPLTEALEDHSAEGLAILIAEPLRFTQAVIVAMLGLVLCGLMWSFFGHADVIVTAQGSLFPDSEVRRLYAPVDGELADLYIAEGQPVSKGDLLARLNARGAIEAATNALQAQLKLEDAEREWKQFPEKKALMERKAAGLKQAMELAEHQHDQQVSQGTAKLAEAQRAQIQGEHATPPARSRTSTRGYSRCPAEAGYPSFRLRARETPCWQRRTPTCSHKRSSAS